MKLRSTRTGIVCLSILASVATMAAGCAEERDPINRVQTGALAKSFFVGADLKNPTDDPQFRMKAFNVGATVGQSQYTIGEYSALDRVRWEITENLLIARKAYEIAPGADNRGTNATGPEARPVGDKNLTAAPTGAIVAAYRILGHFDIKRAYNATTGEELNVVEENQSDRPYYEREFMRVDWSTNIVDGPNDPTRFFSEHLGGPATPVAYAVTDPTADDAPHVEADKGYLDVTNKFTVAQEMVKFPWGEIPKCQLVAFMTGSSSYDCNAQEAVVRMSFARIDPQEDFESFEDSVAWRDVVGNMGGDGDAAQLSFGSAPRQGYDPQYGYTDPLTKRFKNIHNLWEKSHQAAKCASDADADKNGTADACENAVTGHKGHGGSRCDLHTNTCTIPVRDRAVRTVGYWLNREAPESFQDEVDAKGNRTKRGTLEDLTHSWNQLLEVSVAYRREVECRATGDGDRATCHGQFFEDGGPESKVMVSYGGWLIDKVKPQAVDAGRAVLSACHNPVRVYDPKDLCGEPGTFARLGDQRKNFLVYWPFDSRAPYGGVAGVTPDPLTGEIRGASATIMGRSASYAAAQQRDIIQLALGDLNMEDLVKGVPAERYVEAVRSGGLAAPGLVRGLGKEEIAHRLSAVDHKRLQTVTGTAPSTETGLEHAVSELKRAAQTGPDLGKTMALLTQVDALSQKLKSSPYEANMLGGRWLTASLGASPSANLTDELVAAASPLRGMDPARVDAMRATWQASHGERGACFHEGMASGPGSVYLASLAGYFKNKYGSLDAKERGERIYDDLLREAIKGIGLHEIGHSLGLRHNFASSWDAPNYNPQYWQLRTAEGSATALCDAPRSGDKDSCMGPRYSDPLTIDEQGVGAESRPSIDYFANTSTMEYQIERFGETVGLGTYDLHAMKTLYGRVLEAFDDRVVRPADQKAFAAKTMTQLSDRDFVIQPKEGKFTAHYTQTGRAMNVFDKARDCRPATDEEKAQGTWRVVHGQVCAPAPKDHYAFADYKSDIIPSVGAEGVKWHTFDGQGREHVRWPYRYGEQYGAGGYMHTSMGDAGADIYELVQNLSRRFELTYPWTYFRRQNREYSTLSIPQAISSQYFMKARAYHWQVSSTLARAQVLQLNDDDTYKPSVMAQPDLLAFLAGAVLKPEPGGYTDADERRTGKMRIFDVAPEGQAASLTLGIDSARYIGEEFDNFKGGSWDYQKYVSRAGFEVEKALAMMQIVDPRPTLFSVSRENFLDERNVFISFRSDLPDGVDRIVGGVLAEDWEAVAPAVLDPKAPSVTPVDFTRKVDRAPSDRVIFPNIGYKQQLQMAIFAALFSRLGSDMTMVEKMRVWVDGDRAPTIPGARVIKFADPRTGFAYMANRFGDEPVGTRLIDKGIGSRMLARANGLVAEAYDVKRDAAGEPLLDASGKPELKLDGAGAAVVVKPTAELELRKYVGLLDAVRQIGRALGDGPLGGGQEN